MRDDYYVLSLLEGGPVKVEDLRTRVKRHEGLSLEPYADSEGHCTIGYGHKIGPITRQEAERLLTVDLANAAAETRNCISPEVWNFLDPLRREILMEMTFQMGARGLKKFRRMLAALKKKDYHAAADEMLDSLWYRKQTPERCREMAEMMRTGRTKYE